MEWRELRTKHLNFAESIDSFRNEYEVQRGGLLDLRNLKHKLPQSLYYSLPKYLPAVVHVQALCVRILNAGVIYRLSQFRIHSEIFKINISNHDRRPTKGKGRHSGFSFCISDNPSHQVC